MSEGGITRLIFENSHQNNANEGEFVANKLLNGGAVQSDPVYQDSFEREKQRGFDQGYQEAIAKAQQDWDEKVTLITSISDALNQPLKDVDQQIQEKSVEISIAIAKQIVRRELSLDSGQIVSAVKQAIALIPKDGEQVNIHINPKDDQHIKELFSNDEQLSKYNIIQDPTISAGGCRASTDYSLVDLTIDKQIADIAIQVFGDQRNVTR